MEAAEKEGLWMGCADERGRGGGGGGGWLVKKGGGVFTRHDHVTAFWKSAHGKQRVERSAGREAHHGICAEKALTPASRAQMAVARVAQQLLQAETDRACGVAR
jgi:hypothetical protein